MEKGKNTNEIFAEVISKSESIRIFAEQISALSGEIREMASLLKENEEYFNEIDEFPPEKSTKNQNYKAKDSTSQISVNSSRNTTGDAQPGRSTNIISFPNGKPASWKNRQPVFAQKNNPAYGIGGKADGSETKRFHAIPGKLLHADIPDFRTQLQRDGLILLSWDMHITEMGERYTAYWITSVGIPRYYASKKLLKNNFSSAQPDHKSYAAEDGIEFHGQKAPAYMVFVAPELMMSNPQHRELRYTHICKLNQNGYKADYSYRYLLTKEKKKGDIA